MYTKILPPNMAPCQASKLKRRPLVNVATCKFFSFKTLVKANDSSCWISIHTNRTRAFLDWRNDEKKVVKIINKKVREKFSECHNHKLQPFTDTKRKRKQKKKQTSANRKNVRKALRLALSSPNEVIAMLKGLKNTEQNRRRQDLKQIAS